MRYQPERMGGHIHTPELTTLGASAKGWIRKADGLYLHKVGKYEIPSDEILTALGISHISYQISREDEIGSYLSEERKQWIESTGEKLVNSKLFTSEFFSLVTFEEFRIFCEGYGLNAYEEAAGIDQKFYWNMQIADYILNNNDRHEQNWGFFMDNESGKLTGFCPLFDHDHAFTSYEGIISQTMAEPVSLYDAAVQAQKEAKMDLSGLEKMEKPLFLSRGQWDKVMERVEKLKDSI